eukprot:2468633-Rhodomonas_salina.1
MGWNSSLRPCWHYLSTRTASDCGHPTSGTIPPGRHRWRSSTFPPAPAAQEGTSHGCSGHLPARMVAADIFLDTLTYNGHTTVSD